MPRFKMICLAKSRKYNNFCIAGKEIDTHNWIRPITATEHGDLSPKDIEYEDGSHPELLHVCILTTKRPHGLNFQTENHIIDSGYYWTHDSTLSYDDLEEYCDEPNTLWSNTSSSGSGTNDRVTDLESQAITESLYLIKVDNLEIHVQSGYGSSPKKVRGQFSYNGITYNLKITDSILEPQYQSFDCNTYVIDECFLCISLGLKFNVDNCCYKLIAGIITP